MIIDARYELIDEDRIEDTDGILITGTEYLHYMDLTRKYYELLKEIDDDELDEESDDESDDESNWMDEMEGYPPPKTHFSKGKPYTNTCGHN